MAYNVADDSYLHQGNLQLQYHLECNLANPCPANFLSWKCRLFVTSAAYLNALQNTLATEANTLIRLLLSTLEPFTTEANTMNPDQTAPKGAVWSWCILFAI